MKRILTFLFVLTSLFASSQTQFIGAPSVTVVNRGNFKIDSILYLPKRTKTPTDTGALRYQISDSSLYVWTGNAWRKAKNDGTLTSVSAGTGMSFATITSAGSVSADTNVLSTKAWRQKGDDSLGAIIATKGTGTVTSVGTGYGINGGTITTTGTLTADTLNLATRLRLQKVGDSLGVLISEAGGGTVTGVSAGTGMSFTTITSSGAVNADTLVLSTRSWRQKGDDSVSSLIAAKLNISDTATMLSPYAKSAALGLYLPLTGGTLTGGLTGTTGAFTSSGSGNTFDITHSSGSGIGLNITKGGNGEGLYVNKTSGTGNAATIIGTLNATTLVKSGGTATQYLMADGTTSTLTNPVTGTGTTNYIPKFTGTSTLGNSLIFDNGTNIGIGTTSPANFSNFRTIDFRGTSAAHGGIYRTATTNESVVGAFYTDLAINFEASTKHPMYFRNQGIRMAIDTLGNVGIGTTSQAYRLDVNGEGRFQGTLFTRVGTAVGIQMSNTSAIRNAGEQYFDYGTGGTGNLEFRGGSGFLTALTLLNNSNVSVGSTSNGGYKLDVTGTLRNTTGAAFATSSGNVLIGKTTDASVKLDVVGNIASTTGANFATSSGNVVIGGTGAGTTKLDVTGDMKTSGYISAETHYRLANNNAIRLATIDGSGGFVGGYNVGLGPTYIVTGNVSGIYYHQNQGLLFYADTTKAAGSAVVERMRLARDGNLGINTTTASERLDVNGRARVRTIDSTGTGTAMNMLYADATGVIKKAAVPSGGGGSVTSITAGTGLTGGTITTSGTIAVDTASIATRARVQKGVDSVASIAVKGTGITGYFPKWTGASTQDTSQLFQLGRNIGIGTASPTYRLHLPDAGSTANQAMIAGTIFGSDGNGITISPNSSNITIKGGQGNGSIYSGTISSVARWGINTTSISDAVFSVNGDVKIVTVDSTATAVNMLYQDANGIIKKSAVPSGGVSGSGTTSYLPKWTSSTGLGNSVAYDNGGELLISTTEDAGDYKLQVAGAIYTTSTITTGGVNGQSVKPWKLGSRSAAAVTFDGTQYIEVEVNGVLYNLAVVTIN